ncbi:MAG: (d)CMP kinase [Dehalococcoidia bacterium]
MPRPQLIAIDGPVAVGKSTVGRLLARKLGYRFIDTGAMYRALAWKALKLGVSLEDGEKLGELARSTAMEFSGEGGLLMDGQEVSHELRHPNVESGVSLVSRIAEVRQAMVAQQQAMAQDGRVVMAGRDIGTVVLPRAGLKVYLEASAEERARRRYQELGDQREGVDYASVLDDLKRRDAIDSQRATSPLRPAPDARIIDTEGLGAEEVVERLCALVGGI